MRMGKPAWIGMGTASAAALGFSVFMSTERFRVERPNFLVVEREPGFEVRRYTPRLVAYTVVRGGLKRRSRNEAFRRLAHYIFGANEEGRRIAMTSPVSQEPVSALAAPLAMRMEFTMPARFNLQSLPKPWDPEVKLEQMPSATMAVLRFTWRLSRRRAARKLEALRRAVEASPDWRAVGDAVVAQYDGPGAIPFLRRNEVMIEVRRRVT